MSQVQRSRRIFVEKPGLSMNRVLQLIKHAY